MQAGFLLSSHHPGISTSPICNDLDLTPSQGPRTKRTCLPTEEKQPLPLQDWTRLPTRTSTRTDQHQDRQGPGPDTTLLALCCHSHFAVALTLLLLSLCSRSHFAIALTLLSRTLLPHTLLCLRFCYYYTNLAQNLTSTLIHTLTLSPTPPFPSRFEATNQQFSTGKTSKQIMSPPPSPLFPLLSSSSSPSPF